MKPFFALIAAFVLVGCANTAGRLNDVSVGMSKQEVRSTLGDPDETRAENGREFLMYRLTSSPGGATQAACGVGAVYTLGLAYVIPGCQYRHNDYFVLLESGRVVSYGRMGDFGTLAKPEATLNINQNIRTTSQ